MTESNKTQSKALIEALKQPNGARFYRCALQVNPFAYHGRHGKQSQFQNEADYNAAIIESCRANCIEAIAVTDHYRIWSCPDFADTFPLKGRVPNAQSKAALSTSLS